MKYLVYINRWKFYRNFLDLQYNFIDCQSLKLNLVGKAKKVATLLFHFCDMTAQWA